MADGSPLFVERDSPNMSAKLLQQFFCINFCKKEHFIKHEYKILQWVKCYGKVRSKKES